MEEWDRSAIVSGARAAALRSRDSVKADIEHIFIIILDGLNIRLQQKCLRAGKDGH